MRSRFPIRSRRGGSSVEFAMSTLFWVPLLIGTFSLGFKLVRADQVQEICRDVGHMYAYGVDFTQSGNQAIAVRLAQGLNMTTTGGQGVIILSVMKMIGSSDCVSAGVVPNGQTANTTNCPNLGQIIIAQRLYIGNSTLRASSFGTPASNLIDSAGNISLSQQCTNVGLRAPSFGNLLTLTAGQYGYLTETYFSAADIDGSTTNGVYARAIF
jgi:hypothetical protein